MAASTLLLSNAGLVPHEKGSPVVSTQTVLLSPETGISFKLWQILQCSSFNRLFHFYCPIPQFHLCFLHHRNRRTLWRVICIPTFSCYIKWNMLLQLPFSSLRQRAIFVWFPHVLSISLVSPLVNQSLSPLCPLGDSNDTALPSGGWWWDEV